MPQWIDGIAIYCQRTGRLWLRWSSFIIRYKPLHEKRANEWTHHQTCHWHSKCQIRPSLWCLDEWWAWGRVSLCVLSLPHKKVRYSMRGKVCQADDRADALSTDKLGSKKLWYFMMWAQSDCANSCSNSWVILTLRVVCFICQSFSYVWVSLSVLFCYVWSGNVK